MKEHRKNEGAQKKTPQNASTFAHLTENIGDRYRIGNFAYMATLVFLTHGGGPHLTPPRDTIHPSYY